jgi:hypothetical protein
MQARSAGQEAQAAPQTRAWQSRISKKSITTMLVYKEMCDKKGGTNGCERTRLRTVLLLHGNVRWSHLLPEQPEVDK